MKLKTVDEIQSKIEEMQTVKNQMEDIMKTISKLERIQELM
jgi:Asp-tRNA(Asn)/Glu-tRNA(Gln) amidotransferase C subunit